MKKAFTLIEMLAVIIILAVISVLATSTILKNVRDKKSEISSASKEILLSAGNLYVSNHKNDFSKYDGNIYCVLLSQLVEDELLSSPIIDPVTNKKIDDNTVIKVSYEKDSNYNDYKYDVLPIESCKPAQYKKDNYDIGLLTLEGQALGLNGIKADDSKMVNLDSLEFSYLGGEIELEFQINNLVTDVEVGSYFDFGDMNDKVKIYYNNILVDKTYNMDDYLYQATLKKGQKNTFKFVITIEKNENGKVYDFSIENNFILCSGYGGICNGQLANGNPINNGINFMSTKVNNGYLAYFTVSFFYDINIRQSCK